jgi:hypothetical protein
VRGRSSLLEREGRGRLSLDDQLPGGILLLDREDLVGLGHEHGGDRRVERTARSIAHHPGRVRRAAEHPLERRIPGDVDDPNRER